MPGNNPEIGPPGKASVLRIRTPEGIEFALPLAGPFSRMLALAIDFAAIAAIDSILQKILGALAIFAEDLSAGLHVIVYFALTLVYAAACEWFWRGQTIGKRLLGLRVVDSRGLRLEPAQIIVRNLMRFLDGLPLFYLVGGAACVFNRYYQRLGDLAAGTVVIRTPQVVAPDLDRIAPGKYNTLAESRHLAARLRQKVTPELARIGLEALIRRDRLDPAARLTFFADLARRFRAAAPYPEEVAEQISDEQYVRDVIAIIYQPAGRDLTLHGPER
ncbi:MAG TPA: RDD family protein [Bryobacteraceae bacterium]|nr:RDD family protein [Bryobacteraceae bacterium]